MSPTDLSNKLDVSLAIVLASYAFEAYSPSPLVGQAAKGLDGTTVIFTNLVYLQRVFSGAIVVTLKRCLFEPNGGILAIQRKPDPYLVCSIVENGVISTPEALASQISSCLRGNNIPIEGAQKRNTSSSKSERKDNTIDATWNETYYYFVEDPKSAVLNVRAFDFNFGRPPDFLGLGVLSVQEIKDNGTGALAKEFTVPLSALVEGSGPKQSTTPKVKKSGSATVSVNYVTLDSLVLSVGTPATKEVVEPNDFKSLLMKLFIANTETLSDWQQMLQTSKDFADAKKSDKMIGGNPCTRNELNVPQTTKDGKHFKIVGNTYAERYLEQICCIDNPVTSTQATIWADIGDKMFVISFRGTQKEQIKDICTDLNITMGPYESGNPTLSTLMVHNGFMDGFRSVRGSILQILQSLMTAPKSGAEKKQEEVTHNKWHIYITGHSLGGTLATLCAFEIGRIRAGLWGDSQQSPKPDPAGPYKDDAYFLSELRDAHLTMYSYGAPRCGNPAFCAKYNELVPDSHRVVNHKDGVPDFPKAQLLNTIMYAHVGTVFSVDADAEVDAQGKVVCKTESKGQLADMLTGQSIAQHLVPNYFKAISKASGSPRQTMK